VPLTDAERTDEVSAATTDVGDLARRVEVFATWAFTDESAVGAMWFPPRQKIDDPRVPADLTEQMNATDHRDAHRIAVPAHPSDRVAFAGLVRHELEHARQFDEAGLAIFDIQDYLENSVLPEVAGGLDGCAGGLINSIPTEMDANAAASIYLTSRFDADDLTRLRNSERRYLACSLLPPAAPSTLLVRMAAFAVVHRGGVEAHAARTPFTAEAILGSVNTELGRLWKEWGVAA
jgi:hypothetical protein